MLRIQGLRVKYGLFEAVSDLSLEIPKGRIVGLIGPNGAGKTSVLRTIVGLQKPNAGRVAFEGRDITGRESHEVLDLGLVLVPEGRGIFPYMSVTENLLMGAYRFTDRQVVRRQLDACYSLFPLLQERGNQLAGTLSGGQQQMLAIAMGLMAKPRMMLLDEPSLGLAPIVVKSIAETLDRLHEAGVTIVLAEQNAKLATDVADYVYVMQSGRTVVHNTPGELLRMPDIVERYMGVR